MENNYSAQMYPVKCKECVFVGYNIEFEKFRAVENGKDDVYEMTIIQICPLCKQ